MAFSDNTHLFRRLVIVYLLGVYLYVIIKSFDFAYFAIDKGIGAGDIVAIVGALQALMTALMGYAFKIYSDSRGLECSQNTKTR